MTEDTTQEIKQFYWGYHLIVNAAKGKIENITNPDLIKAFNKELVEKIDMKAYGEPFLEDFANEDSIKGGYTLLQPIETSNIAGHFVTESGDFYLDIFSCKDFDENIALNVIHKYFAPENINFLYLVRDANAFPGFSPHAFNG